MPARSPTTVVKSSRDSKRQWDHDHPLLPVRLTPAARAYVAARAAAAGLSENAYAGQVLVDLSGALAAEREAGRTAEAAAARRAASAEQARVRREHTGQLAQLRRQLDAAQQAAADREQAAYARGLADADTPAARAASHRQATVIAAIERGELADLQHQGRMDAARHATTLAELDAARLRHEADAAEHRERLDAVAGRRDAEWEAARLAAAEVGAKVERQRVAPELAQLRAERDAARADGARVTELESTLGATLDRLQVAEAVVTYVKAQELIERARQNPGDGLLRVAAFAAVWAAQRQLPPVEARVMPVTPRLALEAADGAAPAG